METDIKAFTNTLISVKITGYVYRPRETIKYCPDLNDIVVGKRLKRKRWQPYGQKADKFDLSKLTNLIHKEIRECRISKFEDFQKFCKCESLWKLPNWFKISRNIQRRGGVIIYDALGNATAMTD